MKKRLIVLLLLSSLISKADEGMWMPQLIEALNYKDMKKNGFRLSAKQIYALNSASMKDAVAIFGGGCTSEVISYNGLILTNHHCGYSAITALSTVEKNYLEEGYFAMNASEELPCKGLTVTFIRRIDDVTAQVFSGTDAYASERQKDSVIKTNVVKLVQNAEKDNHFEVFVRPFYYGNEYYLFVTERFTDIRLVGTPPENIGKFGGDTDNWMWPRHNADFSMFRIYAGKDNKPAEYSDENIAYKPKYSFPISLKGVNKGDFTMVYGFPGRTQEYLTSYAVDLIINQQDPRRIALRAKRLEVMEQDMKKNDTVRLMYTSRFAGISNYHKKWQGEVMGLMKSEAIEKKQAFEKSFLSLLESDKKSHDRYLNLFSEFRQVYEEYAPLSKQYDYFTECLLGVDAIRMAGGFVKVFDELRKKKAGRENKFEEYLAKTTPLLPFRNFNKETDLKLCKAMLAEYSREIDRKVMPQYVDSLLTVFNDNTDSLSEYIYANSDFVDNEKAKVLYSDFEKNAERAAADPLYQLASSVYQYYLKVVIPQVQYQESQINDMQKDYMAGLRATLKNKKFYPDANGTMRIAYGKAEGYDGPDAVNYSYYTTLDGLVEKHLTGAEDYAVMPRLLELHAKKDYGQYADKNGRLRTCFIASNHTTGGNSGSPVINAKGELIGTNFDRNWEGTMSDIMYNVDFCRNITVDIRFTLWIVDKYAGAGYLIDEMKIIR